MKIVSILCLSAILAQNLLAQTAYYPLQVGNSWQFTGRGPWLQYTVVKDTIPPNGKHYSLIAGGPFQFQRQEANQVFLYTGKSDQLLFDFSRLPHDTVVSIPGTFDTTDIILAGRDSVTLFGRHLRRWIFSINWLRHAIDDEEGYEIVDSLGITGISLADGTEDLHSALIDAESYQVVDVARSPDTSPPDFSLAQNFPNPFNPRTRITFTLPTMGNPRFEVYTTTGQKVFSLDLGIQKAGTHYIDFDGSRLSSGVFFYRINFGPLSKSLKFVLLR